MAVELKGLDMDAFDKMKTRIIKSLTKKCIEEALNVSFYPNEYYISASRIILEAKIRATLQFLSEEDVMDLKEIYLNRSFHDEASEELITRAFESFNKDKSHIRLLSIKQP